MTDGDGEDIIFGFVGDTGNGKDGDGTKDGDEELLSLPVPITPPVEGFR